MNIYEFSDYKTYFREWLKEQPRGGRGVYKRLADTLKISTTMVSHIFKADKQLTLEHALDLTEFLALNEREGDYLLLLVNLGRAGTQKLKMRLKKRVLEQQKKALRLSSRLPKHIEISDADRAVFYSSWIFSGIRNLSAIPKFSDADLIAQRLKLPRESVQQAIDFLLRLGLCKLEDGQIQVGPQQTRIDAHSPLVSLHHKNWRMHGFTKMGANDDTDIFYTGPMSLSNEAAGIIRAEIPAFIQKINELVSPSPSEVVRCLNIDWFDY